MQNIYKNICSNLYNLVWAFGRMEKPNPPPDFSWLKPEMLEPGDILLVGLIMPQDFRASQMFQVQVFKHGALVVGHDQVLDVRVPHSKIISLKKFLKPCSKVTVVKLKNRPKDLEAKLQEFAKRRSKQEFQVWMVGYATYLFYQLQYFMQRATPQQLKEYQIQQKELVRFGNTFYGCSTAIYQAWLEFIPEIRVPFWEYFYGTQIPLITPDPQLYFIVRHPELFEIINPPSQAQFDKIEELYNPVPKEITYNPLQKQKNFIKHGRLLIFLSGIASKLIHNPRVPSGLKKYLKRYKILIQRAAEESLEFAFHDQAKKKLLKTAKLIVEEMEFQLPVDPKFSVENEIKEIEEELNLACSPCAKL